MKFVILTTTPEEFSPTKLKEAVEAAGHEAILVNPDKCYIHIGKDPYVSHEGKKISEVDVVIPRFSDDNAEYKLAIIKHFETIGAFVLNPADSVRLANNKLDSQIFLFKNGFKTPRSAMLTCESQLDFALKSLETEFPVIAKTLFGKGGVGVMKIDSHASLKSVIQLLLDRGVKFVIQEFIKNDGACRIMTIGGKYFANMFRKVDTDVDFRTNSGQGSKYEVFKPSDREIEVCENIAKLTNINFCAVDYLVDEDGEPVIFEFNSSPGFETISEANPDIDVAKAVVEYCLSAVKKQPEEITQTTPPEEVKTPVAEPDFVPADEAPTPDVDTQPKENQDEAVVVDKETSIEPIADIDMTKSSEGDGIVGVESNVIIKRFNDGKEIVARVDTGASLCSIHAENIEYVEEQKAALFTYNNVRYKCRVVRVAHVRTADGELADRYVVHFDIVVDGNLINDVEFTLNDRADMKYDVLIGRNALKTAELVVDPGE